MNMKDLENRILNKNKTDNENKTMEYFHNIAENTDRINKSEKDYDNEIEVLEDEIRSISNDLKKEKQKNKKLANDYLTHINTGRRFNMICIAASSIVCTALLIFTNKYSGQ